MLAGEQELSYFVDGNSEAPPIVLLHDLSLNARDFSKVSLALAQRFRVYSLNLRGHGGSGWGTSYGFRELAGDVAAFLEGLRLEPAALLGHGLGGTVATFVAAHYPTKISALVVEEGPPPRRGGPRMALGELGVPGVAYDRAALIQVVAQMEHPDPSWANLGLRIQAPTLILGGGPLSHIPESWSLELAATIARSRFLRIPAGHFIHKRKTAEFLAEVGPFLETHLAPRSTPFAPNEAPRL
ncbi:MAG: alpha/beta hydrolase [Myxococcota bacterium]